jgi:hypothetical protein
VATEVPVRQNMNTLQRHHSMMIANTSPPKAGTEGGTNATRTRRTLNGFLNPTVGNIKSHFSPISSTILQGYTGNEAQHTHTHAVKTFH